MTSDIQVPKPMKKQLEGTKTEENLHTALSGEAQAYLRYLWFASKAKAEGYHKIAEIFEQTANNESEHAEIWFTILGGEGVTERNLAAAAAGEHFEWSEMYKQFAQTAREEGFDEIAGRFERVAAIERRHENRFEKYRTELEGGHAFLKYEDEERVVWVCLACGQIIVGDTPPENCPTCGSPKGHFARFTE